MASEASEARAGKEMNMNASLFEHISEGACPGDYFTLTGVKGTSSVPD